MTSQSNTSIPLFPLESAISISNPPTELSYQGRRYTFVDPAVSQRRGTKQLGIWEFGHEYRDLSDPTRRI
jgi:hypothetical protein